MKMQSLFLLAILSLLTLFVVSCGEENPLNPDEINQRGTISGTIVDQFEKPLSGVSVTTNKEGFNSNSILDGSYSIPDIESNQYTLTFSKVGFFDTTMDTTIAIAKMAQVININMVMRKKTGTISGSVTDTAGAALTNVTVTLSPTVEGVGSEKSINTGTDAAFSIEKVDLGIYEVQCTHPSYTAVNTPLCTLSSDDYTDSISVSMSYNGGGDVGTITGTLKSGPGEVATLTNWGVSVLGTSVGVSGNADSESVNFTITNVPAGTYSIECTDLKHKADTVKNITVTVGKATDMGTITLVDDGTKWMNRSVLGQFSVHRDTVDTVILEVKGEGIPNWTPFECSYNKNYGTVSGVVLVPESGQAWDVRAKAFIRRNDSLIKIGQCNKVEFTKSSGDVELTEFIDPTNAIPTIEFTCKDSLKINDSITFSPIITENFEGTVTSYLWNFSDGETANSKEIRRAFLNENINEEFSLTITDDDGNRVTQKHSIVVTNLTPEIEFLSKPDFVACSEELKVPFSIIDDGTIKGCQYKINNSQFKEVNSDSLLTIITPDSANAICSLIVKVTDDDDNSVEEVLTFNLGTFQKTYADFHSSGFIIETTDSSLLTVGNEYSSGNVRGLWLIKVSKSGETVWKKELPNLEHFYIKGLIESNNGFILIGNKLTPPLYEHLLVKTDLDGNFTDKIRVNSGLAREVIKHKNNLYITGYVRTHEDSDNTKLLISSTSLDGTVNWSKQILFDESISSSGHALTTSNDGNLLVTGKINEKMDTTGKVVVAKMSLDGDLIWNKTVKTDSEYGQTGVGIFEESDETLTLVANCSLYVASDTYYKKSIHALSLSSDGDLINEVEFPLWDYGYAEYVKKCSDGNYVFVGSIEDGNAASTNIYLKMLLVKFTRDGNILWEKRIGNTPIYNGGLSVVETFDKGIAMLGFFQAYLKPIHELHIIKTDANGQTVPFE